MDLRLHIAVISRFRYLIVAGVILAAVLTFISLFRVSLSPKLSLGWRQSETWKSTETMLLTQRGCSVFTIQPSSNATSCGNVAAFPATYSLLANSDAVRALVIQHGPLNGKYVAYPVIDTSTGSNNPTPFMSVDGFGTSQARAIRLAGLVSQAFQDYVHNSQVANRTPIDQRVLIDVTSAARKATLVQGRRLTVPIVLFLAVLIATLALAYVLENLRPRAAGNREARNGAGAEQLGEVPSLVPEPRAKRPVSEPKVARGGAVGGPEARS